MRATIVAEIGSNWEGSLSKAKKMIRLTKKAGANAVKFQIWRAEDLYSSKHPHWKDIKKSELNFKKIKILKKYSDEIGIEFFCSAFYPEAIDFLESINVKRYKVASRTCIFKDPFSKETLERKASTKKPIIISMGMGGNKKKIKNIFSSNKTIFCYCISDYPLEFKKINWNEAIKFEGFSDHTVGITAPLIFAVMKKERNAKHILIEKHVKLKESKGPDAETSIDTDELSQLVNQIKIITKLKIVN
ncbi:N-acetylneuraminate synthase family protein [Candidatus Nitrosopelagicus sp.]|nr:N-acetylneuraminate synthase family protein [Candidatus Nitrosopelagicus sp.]